MGLPNNYSGACTSLRCSVWRFPFSISTTTGIDHLEGSYPPVVKFRFARAIHNQDPLASMWVLYSMTFAAAQLTEVLCSAPFMLFSVGLGLRDSPRPAQTVSQRSLFTNGKQNIYLHVTFRGLLQKANMHRTIKLKYNLNHFRLLFAKQLYI